MVRCCPTTGTPLPSRSERGGDKRKRYETTRSGRFTDVANRTVAYPRGLFRDATPLPGFQYHYKKLPAEMKEMMFQAKAPEALEVLARCLHSKDERVTAAQTILDCGYGRPAQTIDANPIQLYAEVPMKSESSGGMAKGCREIVAHWRCYRHR